MLVSSARSARLLRVVCGSRVGLVHRASAFTSHSDSHHHHHHHHADKPSPWTLYGRPPLTKIVATIGPVSENLETLQGCVREGLRVMRVNFSHATFEEAELRLTNLRKSEGMHKRVWGYNFNLRATMLDTQGPEIRTGRLRTVKETGNKQAKVLLYKGQEIELTTNPESEAVEYGDSSLLFVSYPQLASSVKEGSTILLDDGHIKLTVLSTNEETRLVRCVVDNTGELGERKGVNLPNSHVFLPAMSEKDRIDIAFGVRHDVDFVAASFVRRASDVEEIRAFMREEQDKHFPASHPLPHIISKIESTEGMENFEEILAVSDGIMVARGDLGVEIPLQHVTLAQKHMVKRCREVGKPVVVATQMLETMIKKPRPTRAEVSDVTNAIIEGADAVMLSGESANGDYPIESIATMRSIIHAVEGDKGLAVLPDVDVSLAPVQSNHEAIASAAVLLAHQLKACAIVVATKNGKTARVIAKHRPRMPIVCLCSNAKVARQLNIVRGVQPIVLEDELDWNSKPHTAVIATKAMHLAKPGSRVVLVSKEETGFSHEMSKVVRIVHT